jgi:GNAT superfamily N-acetyltransferase
LILSGAERERDGVMAVIKQIHEGNKPSIIASLKPDTVRHVFAVNDLQNDPQHTTAYAALEGGNLLGYILIYTATNVPSVILECKEEVADILLERAPRDNFIAHAPPNLLHAIKKRFPHAKHYIEDWMLVGKNEAHFFKSDLVRKLRAEVDSMRLLDLLLGRKDRPTDMLKKKYADWISKMPTYGVFRQGRLVSVASSFIQLPQIWLIGGVYTQPEYRNMGYATLATSAITEEALKEADTAALFARSDNRSAIRVYEKLGYRKIGEKVWVDIGTGLKP